MQKQLICAALAAAFAAGTASAALKDGTYETQVIGHNAPMTLKVTISDGRITNIDYAKNLETLGVGKVALVKLSDEVKSRQSIGVDKVTGATFTSTAFLSGMEDILEKAGASDADLAKWSKSAVKISSKPAFYSADVAVVGGGGAGLAAALSALESGARQVVILEKLGYLGGSTQVSGGAFNAVDDKRQKAQGIVDSFPTFFEATMRGGHYVGNPELVHYLTYNSIGALEWLEKHGVKFKDKIGAATGSLGQRSHYGVEPAGWAYTHVLEERLAEYGDRVKILTDTPAKSLIVVKGAVKGVKAVYKGKQPVTVSAKSVVIATGGFGANVSFRQKVNTGVWKSVKLDSHIGTTNIYHAAQGDGLKLAQKAGADIIGLSDIQLHPNGTPGTGLMQDIGTFGRNRIFINTNGDRFVSEGAARDTLCQAIFAQPGGQFWLVMNHLRYPDETKPDSFGLTMKDMLSLGRIKKADTLDELAALIKVPADHLTASIEEYNAVARNKGSKDRFGFSATNTDDAPMTEGPWYACLKVPTVHHTMGGIHIDVNARALSKKGLPVKGLYAAGEVTGGIHGANRLGGNAIADVFTFGRVAGEQAAKAALAK